MADSLDITDLPYRHRGKPLTGKFGKTVEVDQCLLSVTPGEGWGVTISIKGVSCEITGDSPIRVFAQLYERLELNGVENPPAKTLWANLNIMWMGRVNYKHHQVDFIAFLESLEAVTPSIDENATQIKHPVADWAHLAWGTLEIYLCHETYEWRSFQELLALVQRTACQNFCPTLGDSKFYQRFIGRKAEAELSPIYKREDARAWLIETRSAVMNEEYTGSPLWVR